MDDWMSPQPEAPIYLQMNTIILKEKTQVEKC